MPLKCHMDVFLLQNKFYYQVSSLFSVDLLPLSNPLNDFKLTEIEKKMRLRKLSSPEYRRVSNYKAGKLHCVSEYKPHENILFSGCSDKDSMAVWSFHYIFLHS